MASPSQEKYKDAIREGLPFLARTKTRQQWPISGSQTEESVPLTGSRFYTLRFRKCKQPDSEDSAPSKIPELLRF